MINQIQKAGRGVSFVSYEAFKRSSGNLPLLARMFGVAAIGIAAVHLLNHAAPLFVSVGTGDTTAFVMGQVQTLTHVSVKLMMLGRDVLVFLGLS